MALVTARPSSRVPAETTWEWVRRNPGLEFLAEDAD
jgi:hypothetical protein